MLGFWDWSYSFLKTHLTKQKHCKTHIIPGWPVTGPKLDCPNSELAWTAPNLACNLSYWLMGGYEPYQKYRSVEL